jgi:hypothetical protein
MAVINPKDKALLLRSFDGDLSVEEQAQLDQALHNNAALRKEQQELYALRDQLSALQATPPDGIYEGVMKQVSYTSLEVNLAFLFPRVAAACILILLVSLSSIYFSEGSLTVEAIIGINDLSPEEAYSYLSN